MIRYSDAPLSFWQAISACFSAYMPILKKVWPLILISSALNLVSTLVLKWNAHIGYGVTILVFLGIAFLYAAALKLGDSLLATGTADTKQALQYSRKRYLTLIGGYIIFIAIAAVIFTIDAMLFSLGNMMGNKVYPILATLAVLMSVFVMLLFYFALPIIILDEKNIYQSFKASVKLVIHHWWRTFGILAIIHAIVIGIGAAVMELMSSHNLVILMVWNFIYQVLLYPLIIATILIVLHDLKLRKELSSR